MKKPLVIALLLLFIFTGCATNANKQNAPANPTQTKTTIEANKKPLTANDYVLKLKAAGFPIDNVIVYNEETDWNKLLGRPHQYTSKVNFADTTQEQFKKDDPVGGSIEVFENKADAESRKKYLETMGQSVSLFSEYDYLYGKALLRIHHQLTPKQAEKYRVEFEKIK